MEIPQCSNCKYAYEECHERKKEQDKNSFRIYLTCNCYERQNKEGDKNGNI